MAQVTAKAAIVTGASRGIGLAIAERLLNAGANVCITARKADALAQAAHELGSSDRVLTVPGNTADADHRRSAVESTLERFGSVDILVNNAGINPAYAPLVETDLGILSKTFDTNVTAALGWVQEAHRVWMGAHGGAVVNVASVAGVRATPMIGSYGVSKAAFIHLTSQLALELAPKVRVNAVAPAVVKTRFASALYKDREDEVAAKYPLGRFGVPEDIASAVVFLLDDAAGWITGQTIVLDGGLTIPSGLEA